MQLTILFLVSVVGFVTSTPVHTRKVISDADLDRYRQIVRLEHIAYCDPDLQSNWTCAICTDPTVGWTNVTDLLAFKADPTNAVIGYMGVNHHTKWVFIGFQGARRQQQWKRALTDVKLVTPEEFPNVPKGLQVHKGFLTSYLEGRQYFYPHLLERAEKYPDYSVLLMGHSYGASMASMLALELALRNSINPLSRVELFTFGGPRTGNERFAQFINTRPFGRLSRLVHSNDLVPHLPPRPDSESLSSALIQFLLPDNIDAPDYKHYRGEIWFHPELKRYVYCNDTHMAHSPYAEEADDCSNSVTTMYSVSPHSSSWTKLYDNVCPADPQRRPVDIEYLPNYTVNLFSLMF